MMWRAAETGHVQHELELARRTALILTDPASAVALRSYIFELEDELDRRRLSMRPAAVG